MQYVLLPMLPSTTTSDVYYTIAIHACGFTLLLQLVYCCANDGWVCLREDLYCCLQAQFPTHNTHAHTRATRLQNYTQSSADVAKKVFAGIICVCTLPTSNFLFNLFHLFIYLLELFFFKYFQQLFYRKVVVIYKKNNK